MSSSSHLNGVTK